MGTLIYTVVLGFFSDYTDIVYAKSFSAIFMAAVVLEILTFLVFQLKKKIVVWLKHKPGWAYRALLVFCVWSVMFISKFVFIGVLDLLFGSYVYVYGFFGILIVVLCVTILHKLAEIAFRKLSDD